MSIYIKYLSLSLTALTLTGGLVGLALEPAPVLSVRLNQGIPELSIDGPSGIGVQLLYRTSLEKGTDWKLLTHALTGSKLGSGANTNSASIDPSGFYRLASPTEALASELAWIPAGSFVMGSPTTEDGRDLDEGPQHKVSLDHGFWMGRREVTQGEYLEVIGSNPSQATGDLNRPVEQVTWSEAQTYCQKLTAIRRASGQIPAAYGFRLPTEAEWEYAARSGSTNRFSFGTDPGYVELEGYAWFVDNSGGTDHAVGLKKPNSWGLYDTAGNVWEWCQDWYTGYSATSQTNPKGPLNGSERVARGGSFYYDTWLTRCAARISYPPNTSSSQVGFRVVLAIQ